VCPRDVIWLDQMKHRGTDESTRDFLLVMNLQGPDLRNTLRQQQGMRFHDLAPALFDLLEAVSFLHEAGYLHRDSESLLITSIPLALLKSIYRQTELILLSLLSLLFLIVCVSDRFLLCSQA